MRHPRRFDPMRTFTSIAIAVLGSAALTTAVVAHAGTYPGSEKVCQSAISSQLGLAAVPSQYTLETVHNKMQYRDFEYVVSANDAASTVKDVKVTCRVRKSGSLMALEFDPASAPVNVARQ
jgi:hypothetical protein